MKKNLNEEIKPILTEIVKYEGFDGNNLYDFTKDLYQLRKYNETETEKNKLYNIWQILKQSEKNVWLMNVVLAIILEVDVEEIYDEEEMKELCVEIQNTFREEDYTKKKLGSLLSLSRKTYEKDTNLEILYEHLWDVNEISLMRTLSKLPIEEKVSFNEEVLNGLKRVTGWRRIMKYIFMAVDEENNTNKSEKYVIEEGNEELETELWNKEDEGKLQFGKEMSDKTSKEYQRSSKIEDGKLDEEPENVERSSQLESETWEGEAEEMSDEESEENEQSSKLESEISDEESEENEQSSILETETSEGTQTGTLSEMKCSSEETKDENLENMECSKIDVETIKKILYDRYRKDRNGKDLAKSKKNEMITDAADQAAGHMKRLLRKYENLAYLWKIPEVVEEMMCEEVINMNSRSQELSAISVTLKHMNDDEKNSYIGDENKIRECLNTLNKWHRLIICMKLETRDQQELTETEKAIVSKTNWKNLTEKVKCFTEKYPSVDKIETKEQLDRTIQLILSNLYVQEHAPRRLEYLTMKWKNYDERKDNYVKEGIITLNDYKTASSYKQYRFAVGKYLEDELEKIRKYRETEENEYLFGLKQQVVQSGYKTRLVQKVFDEVCGLRLSVNILRKLYINYMTKNGKLKWTSERKTLATRMGHSVTLQQETYTKRMDESDRERRHTSPKRSKKMSPNSQQEEKLMDEIRRSGNAQCQWLKVKMDNADLFENVPLKTMTNWGVNLRTKMLKTHI